MLCVLCGLAGLACSANIPSLRGEAQIERSVVRIVNHSQKADWYSPWTSAAGRSPARAGNERRLVLGSGIRRR